MKKTEKTKYEIDPLNRLVVAETGRKSKLPKFRKILDGKIKIDKGNTFIYRINKSQDSTAPQQIKLTGKWSLDDEHNLVLTLDKQHKQCVGDKIKIKGEIIDAKADKLAFSVTTKNALDQTQAYILELGGIWQADKNNRLSFNVKRDAGKVDKLIMVGKWKIGKQNQIIYIYTKRQTKGKRKITNNVTLKGYWDITEKHRILYIMNKKISSQFDFKVSIGKPLGRGLQYEIGIGDVPSKKKITLFGDWKINKKLGVLFEMPYENGKLKRVVFGASCKLGDDYKVDFRLKNQLGKDMGIDVKFSKKILKDQGEIFLRGITSGEEKQILLGAGWRW
ncbi:MAG: hypothetical protein ABIH71_05455 [Candidatus Omnitrophota bacterium]